MLYGKSLCFSVMLLTLMVYIQSCDRSLPPRYISESDTSFSADIRNLSKKINKDPKNAELYYKRSNAFFFEDNYKQATLDIEYALQLDSNKELYHYSRGKYLMAGDTANAKEAEHSFTKAIRINPKFLDAHLDLAKL